MHHFLYPTQDAYISNKPSEINKNFGLDEMLIVGVSQSYSRITSYTKTYSLNNEYVSGINLQKYSGKFTGSFFGRSSVEGSILGDDTKFTSSYFSGFVSGSLNGIETGSSIVETNFSGSVLGFSGIIVSKYISGNVTGSITASCFSTFTGNLYEATGSATGYFTGNEIRNEQNTTVQVTNFINRSLLKFDLSFISQSISSGEITNPKFFLRMYVTEARELPIRYKIHIFPVSQSWTQGDGYYSDDGSNQGVSWNWRNEYSGSSWYTPYNPSPLTSSVDYLNNYYLVTESFSRGGGTWYNVPCSQSFNYESSDIYVNVTPIVNSWLNGSIPNEGFIVMCSEETNSSGSNAHLFFFSRDTNTIFIPHLDVGWNDQVYITGSFGTGSITSITYPAGISGSMLSSSYISGLSASGSVVGNMFLALDFSESIVQNSKVKLYGQSNNIRGLFINGYVTGSSFLDVSGSRYITASLQSGDFQDCLLYGSYSSSMFTGILTGSFHPNLLTDHSFSASINNSEFEYYQRSPSEGWIVGYQSSSNYVVGVVSSGLLKGAEIGVYYTGSYLTSSFTTTNVEITSSKFSPINSQQQFVVIIQNLKESYTFGDMPRINVFSREKYPLKTFERAPQQPVYVTPRLLPSSSYYSIRDYETDEVIIDFDEYSKISCDLSGHYFVINTTAFGVERYYKLLTRVIFDDGKIYTFDNNNIFKLTK